MKALRFTVFALFCCVIAIGCKKKETTTTGGDDTTTTTTTTSGIDFDGLAKGVCDCTSDLLNLMDKQNELTEAGDTEGLTALLTDMAPKLTKMETCITELQAKYPGVDGDPENEAKAEEALKRVCPKFAEMQASMGQ